jgi:hypothetical protein
MTLRFDHSYARDLPGTYLRAVPDVAPAPQLLVLNQPLAADLGLSLDPDDVARWFSGAEPPPGAEPISQAYAGHQFGGFSPHARRRTRLALRAKSSRRTGGVRIFSSKARAARPIRAAATARPRWRRCCANS